MEDRNAMPTEAMVEAYRVARSEASGWCGCYDSDERRHYIVNGNDILWEQISEDYAAGHLAMWAELRRLRDVHALSASLAIKPLAPAPSDHVDGLEAKVERLTKALEFYANPEIYKPHPHGLAFDGRDLSFYARTALAEESI